jgi:hypothetical protein
MASELEKEEPVASRLQPAKTYRTPTPAVIVPLERVAVADVPELYQPTPLGEAYAELTVK